MKDIARQGKKVIFSVWAHSVLGSPLRPFCRTIPGPWFHTLCDFETRKTNSERVPKKKRKRFWVLRLHYWILTGIRRELPGVTELRIVHGKLKLSAFVGLGRALRCFWVS